MSEKYCCDFMLAVVSVGAVKVRTGAPHYVYSHYIINNDEWIGLRLCPWCGKNLEPLLNMFGDNTIIGGYFPSIYEAKLSEAQQENKED